MKHIKLFENNQSIQSIRSKVKEFNELLSYMQPMAIAKYYELANDPDYETEYGDDLDRNIPESELHLEHIGSWTGANSGLQFVLRKYNEEGDHVNHFYLNVLDEEVEQMIVKFNANKYNL